MHPQRNLIPSHSLERTFNAAALHPQRKRNASQVDSSPTGGALCNANATHSQPNANANCIYVELALTLRRVENALLISVCDRLRVVGSIRAVSRDPSAVYLAAEIFQCPRRTARNDNPRDWLSPDPWRMADRTFSTSSSHWSATSAVRW